VVLVWVVALDRGLSFQDTGEDDQQVLEAGPVDVEHSAEVGKVSGHRGQRRRQSTEEVGGSGRGRTAVRKYCAKFVVAVGQRPGEVLQVPHRRADLSVQLVLRLQDLFGVLNEVVR